MFGHLLAVAVIGVTIGIARAQDAGSIASMDDVRFQAPKEKGRMEPLAGKVGNALRFRIDKDSPGVFFTSNIHGNGEWDRAEGFSFWVKGEGASGFCGVEFMYDDDHRVRYDGCFPMEGREWKWVTVAWSDLIPVLPGPRARPLGTPDGNRPSKLTGIWIGRGWYWGNYPALDFALDDVRLEPTVPRSPDVPLP